MITAIGEVLKEVYSRNWITPRDRNFSLRQGSLFRITPSIEQKTIINLEHICQIVLASGVNPSEI